MEKVSIIVPVYNVEKYIERCLLSIINQSYKNIEIVVVNDGTKDNSEKIIKKIQKQDNRIKYYVKENGGLSDARNYGLDKVTGKYVCFVDSDDFIEKTYVEDLYNSIKRNKTKVAICDIARVYNNKVSYDNIGSCKIPIYIHPAAWNKMFDVDIIKKNNILFPKGLWYEDLCFTTKILMKYKYSIIDKPLYNYVQNSNSIMHTFDERIFNIYLVLNDIKNYLINNNLYSKNKELFEFINIYHVLIGTIYRASFKDDFSVEMIKEIYSYVNDSFESWNQNIYLKKMPMYYKIYLRFLHKNHFGFVYYMLKKFHNLVHL